MSWLHTAWYTVSPFFCVVPGIPAAALASAWSSNLPIFCRAPPVISSNTVTGSNFFWYFMWRPDVALCHVCHTYRHNHTHIRKKHRHYMRQASVGTQTAASIGTHTACMHACNSVRPVPCTLCCPWARTAGGRQAATCTTRRTTQLHQNSPGPCAS